MRNSILCAIIFLVSLNLLASSSIYIKAKDCDSLTARAEAVLAWSHKLGENFDTALPDCVESGDRYAIDLFTVSPQKLRKYHNKSSEISGPNCWNSVLVFANILPTLTYTTESEMNFWMNSPLCMERGAFEAPKPGDIIAIRKGFDTEVHAFTYLMDDFSFSKNDYSKYSKYDYESSDAIFALYNVPLECRHLTSTSELPSICYENGWATYYDCTSLKKYNEKIKFRFDQDAHTIEKLLSKISNEIYHYLFIEPDLFEIPVAKLEERLRLIESKILVEMGSLPLNQNEIFFYDGMLQKIISLETQLGIIKQTIMIAWRGGHP